MICDSITTHFPLDFFHLTTVLNYDLLLRWSSCKISHLHIIAVLGSHHALGVDLSPFLCNYHGACCSRQTLFIDMPHFDRKTNVLDTSISIKLLHNHLLKLSIDHCYQCPQCRFKCRYHLSYLHSL